MLPNVPQSFKLQRQTQKVVGLKLCSDCLLLSIFLLCKNRQPFEKDRQELFVIQKMRQAAVILLKKSKYRLIENCGPKGVCWPRPAFSVQHACRKRIHGEKLVYCLTL